MNQLGTEDLQPFPQFFDLMLNVFFYCGSFMKPVTDVDVHEHLKLANGDAQTSAFYGDCTPAANIARPEIEERFERSTVLGLRRQSENLRADLFAAGHGGRYDP